VIIMEIDTYKDLYIAELQELANFEEQLGELLLEMAEVASNKPLKDALAGRREETLVQQERLVSILTKHRANAKAHTDQAMQALVNETRKMLEMVKGKDLRDAAAIASLQKIEHYEIAAYGSAAALAGQMDLREDQRTLHGCLEEEKKADALLTQLAKAGVNRAASQAN
jgi:ferritin-like metal-binding protein YciE